MISPVDHILGGHNNKASDKAVVIFTLVAYNIILLMVVGAVDIQSAVILNSSRIGTVLIGGNGVGVALVLIGAG